MRPHLSARRMIVLLVLAVGPLALVGCGTDSPSQTNSETKSGQKVVAAIAPLAEIVREISSSDTQVTTLAAPGVEPHDLELTASQINEIEDADLVVYVRGLIPQLDKAVDNRKRTSLDVLTAVDTVRVDGAIDPHVWLDPTRFVKIGEAIGASLSSVDKAKLAAYTGSINKLQDDFSTGLKSCKHREIVTAHEAFGYLAERFDLKQISVSGLSPEAEPDPQRLAELTDIIKQTGATTVFAEQEANNDFADALAREAGAKVAVLSPMEWIPDGSTYSSVMRANLAALRSALGCT
jgi:zinc transport system substrate-binding protein